MNAVDINTSKTTQEHDIAEETHFAADYFLMVKNLSCLFPEILKPVNAFFSDNRMYFHNI
jgi:hypothetical protein